MMDDSFVHEALRLLRKLTGQHSTDFRSGQLEVICRLVAGRQRVLLVKRTGWGKSAVYFIATRMLRDRGSGPTLLVSPLLALMRNQIEAAERMGVRAVTINSSNRAEWDIVEEKLNDDAVDILLISPERLANQKFRSEVLPAIARRSGLLVIDEAHCLSDWGHDFRPDYRRIVRVLDFLTGVPVLCCTATANTRVIEDVTVQLDSQLVPVRGPLARAGLRLHVLEIPSQAERLTWLATVLRKLKGTGVIYCLTITDTQRLAGWLQLKGISAVAYSGGGTDSEDRINIEQDLLHNKVKVVVATSALGMGFDKPDLSFVIHYQSPGSPIAYYQQVGRAGRAVNESWGILLRGREDADIQGFFISSAFSPADLAERVVELLEERAAPMSRDELFESVNVRWGQLDNLLKNLEVDGAVERDGSRWRRTLRRWQFDRDRVESVTAQRRAEQGQMLEYIRTDGCRMQILSSYLDDLASPCGICDNCAGQSLAIRFDPEVLQQAVEYLRKVELFIEPRKQLPDRKRIPTDRQLERGRSLVRWGDSGWGTLVVAGKQDQQRFDDRLVNAAADLIRRRWAPEPTPTWVSSVPSLRNPGLVRDFATRLAASLRIPYRNVVEKARETEPQKTMQNNHQQYRNVRGAFRIRGAVPRGPVLLVDDVVDSKWTLTTVGGQLRGAGAGPVYAFALADTAGRSVR